MAKMWPREEFTQHPTASEPQSSQRYIWIQPTLTGGAPLRKIVDVAQARSRGDAGKSLHPLVGT